MNLRNLFTLLCILFLSRINAQTTQEDILFKVDDASVFVSEFLRVYNKNLDLVQDESQKDINEYLTLYINYKLKLKEAKSLGFHKKPSYLRELNTYKKQLAKSFLTDTKVTDELIEEAYNRVSNEVKANHILIKVPENASPQDTLLAYNNIVKLRNRTLTEGFETVRKEVHNGQTIYGEELGYFSGFKMVYKFENAAFNTEIGAISQPFRTRFGYHFLKVFDKRKSRGERTVAHIMLSNTKEGDTISEKPETRIQDIYKKLNQGEAFKALAKQFSDDKNSASKGGLLKSFSGGQLGSQEFEDIAFGLNKVNDVSEPFQTKYGWHIVKLYEIKLTPPFEDMKSELEAKVKRDERSKRIDDALIDKLKVKYNVSDKQPALAYFVSILNADYYKRVWKLPVDFEADKPLVEIGDKQFTFKDFGDYLVKNSRNTQIKTPFKKVVSNKYEAFLNKNLVQYQEDNLESENKDFAHIVDEYRDGLLLFDLMETTIWNASKTDSVGIQEYYNTHKMIYNYPERVDAVVATSTKQKTLKNVAKLLKEGMGLNDIKKQLNTKDNIQVVFTSDIMDATHQALPKNFEFKKGISKIYNHNNSYVMVQVKEVLPKEQKSLEDAKGAVISDYQIYKEETWLKKLSKKYKVVVNQEMLEKVKSQIKN